MGRDQKAKNQIVQRHTGGRWLPRIWLSLGVMHLRAVYRGRVLVEVRDKKYGMRERGE